MKKLTLVCCAAVALCSTAFAEDKGPDRVTKADAPAFSPIVIEPAGFNERFVVEYILFDAPADQTQTVKHVVGTVTNTVTAFVPSSTVKTVAITNVPPLLYGDKLVIVPSGTTSTTNNVYLYGRRWN